MLNIKHKNIKKHTKQNRIVKTRWGRGSGGEGVKGAGRGKGHTGTSYSPLRALKPVQKSIYFPTSSNAAPSDRLKDNLVFK